MATLERQNGQVPSLRDRVVAAFAKALICFALLLPYGLRIRFFGWLVAVIVAPIAGWKRRVHENLGMVMPELPQAKVRSIANRVCNNVGRTLIEIYSGKEFLDKIEDTPFEGPGSEILRAAQIEGRPMVLITAHIGNYDVIRGGLARQGFHMGALYKPMKNKAFNTRYVDSISAIGQPVFPVGRVGVPKLVRHLKDGGTIGIVADVANFHAPVLSFFDHPAHTSQSAAEWALKFNALLIPIFALRQPDGLHFRVHVDEPIPHGHPEDMMQAYNDVVEGLVHENMDQWFWIHRRWKLSRDARASLQDANKVE